MPADRWLRQTELNGSQVSGRELWTLCRVDGSESGYEVDVRVGKPLDVLGLKNTSLDEIREYAQMLRRRADATFATGAPREVVAACPVCDASGFELAAKIYGAEYVRCGSCGHVFVAHRPPDALIHDDLESAEEIAATYTDVDSAETRMREVVEPKLQWVVDTYCRAHGSDPASILDVGAGGGHFVAACRRRGLNAEGYETSAASRAFARSAFEVDLLAESFLDDDRTERVDVVTFWGLLEYVPSPAAFVRRAARRLSPTGLLVIEVPRYDCLGTAIQAAWPQVVARHLDPTTHIQCFSDTSAATLLVRAGFAPTAAWYFGMDAYEVLVQCALAGGGPRLLEELAHAIPKLQSELDRARSCDDLVMAATPHAG